MLPCSWSVLSGPNTVTVVPERSMSRQLTASDCCAVMSSIMVVVVSSIMVVVGSAGAAVVGAGSSLLSSSSLPQAAAISASDNKLAKISQSFVRFIFCVSCRFCGLFSSSVYFCSLNSIDLV